MILEPALLRCLFDEAPDGIALAGPDLRYVEVNERFGEIVGYSREQLLSMTVAHLVAPEEVEHLGATAARLQQGGWSRDEWKIRRGDGREVHVEVSGRLLSEGHWVAFMRDVSVQRRAESEHRRLAEQAERIQQEELIRANEQLLDSIFELLPVGVWIADDSGRIVRTNPAGQRVWGGARYVKVPDFGEYRGWWADSGEPITADEWALARALTKGETSLGEIVHIQCFDGSFKTIVNSAMPLYDEQGRFSGAIVVNEDVTALRQSQEDLRYAVEARDEMLRIVSHDLRSPLQSIVLSTQLIKIQAESVPGGERMASVADRILRVTRSVARLADDLLDLTAIEDGRLRVQRSPLDPELLLDEVVDTHQAQAESHGIALAVTSTKPAPAISADHGRLLQTLSNLVSNALKFVPSGGSVSLRVDDEEHEVRFSVVDTGPGIPPEHLPRVFEPFWQQTSADRRGRGLGLAIAKGIVEAHGGRIWLESELGRGTTVCFTVSKAAGSSAS